MNNKRNIIVMFLFVMLSFAIISEVSAVSDAEADGTGFDPSVKSVNMTNHDFAGERQNMQNHDNDFDDEFKFPNEQNSFDKSPEFDGDQNIGNEHFYEHDMNDKTPEKDDFDFNDLDERHNPLDNMSGLGPRDLPLDNMSGLGPRDLPGDFNITGDRPKDDMKDNMSGPKPKDDIDGANQHEADDKNASPMLPAKIKDPKDIKKDSKDKNKKINKKSKNKKSKSPKKSKKMKKSLKKSSKKERAKL